MSNHTVTRASRASTIAMLIMVPLLILLISAPFWAGRAELRLMGEICLYLSLASLWNLLAGYAGLVSVGQQAFVGFGGYLLFALTMFADWHPLAAALGAGVLGLLIAMPVAVLMFRLTGAYFAIGTWVVAEVFRLSFAQISALGGGSGTSLAVSVVKRLSEDRSMRESLAYWLALGLAVAVLVVITLLLRSRTGLALTAIRDNDVAASSLGVDVWRTKFVVYIVTAGLTALTGALIFLQKLRISPDAAFSVNDWTAFVIFIVVIGGIGTVEGPVIGTLVFFLLRETMADLGTIYLIVLGVVAIIIMLTAPQGLWGLIRSRFGLSMLPVIHRVKTITVREPENGP